MALNPILLDKVSKVAASLLLEGKRPSVRLVRERLGGGSFETLTPYVKAWWSNLQKTGAPAPSLRSGVAPACPHCARFQEKIADLEAQWSHEKRQLAEKADSAESLAYERFEAERRYLMLEVDKARQAERSAKADLTILLARIEQMKKAG